MMVRGKNRCRRIAIIACVAPLAGLPVTGNAASVLYRTYKGGTGQDVNPDVDFDSSLRMVVAGQTQSASDIATLGAYDTSLGGTQDGFVAQYTSGGLLNWSTYYGGNGLDAFASVVHDSSGHIYAGGYTESTSGVALNWGAITAHQGTLGGGRDGMLTRFDSSGTAIWSTYFGGLGNDEITGVCVASDGSVFATGYTESTTKIALNATHHMALSSSTDGFIAKFNSSGTLLWSTYYGGNAHTASVNCAVDSLGSVIIVGHTYATTGIHKLGWDAVYDGARDGFLAKLSSAGGWTWGSYYGGTAQELLPGVAVDSSDAIYIAGGTDSLNAASAIAGGVGANDTTPNGGTDGFYARFTPLGVRSFGSYYGDTGFDDFHGISVLGTSLFMIGTTDSTMNIATAGSLDTSFNGGLFDGMFIVSPTAGGAPTYGMYLGGTSDDYGDGIAARSTNEVALVSTTGSSGIATAGAPDTSFGGALDVFLERIKM